MLINKIMPLIICCILASCSRPEHDQGKSQEQEGSRSAEEPKAQLVELPAAKIVTPELSAACNLEVVNGIVVPDAKPIEAMDRKFKVSGWLYDDVSGRVPSHIYVRVASQSGNGRVWQQEFVPGIERPDVQQSRNVLGVLKSGFSGGIDASALESGLYRLRLSYERDGKEVVCDNGRAIVLN